MKKVIDGKVYDTETARKIGSGSRGHAGNPAFRESLYKTKNGAYFIAGTGCIISQTPGEALIWCANYLDATAVEKEFAELIEEA